jgi:hypothetical protein
MKCRLFHKWRLDPIVPYVGLDVLLKCKRCGKRKTKYHFDYWSFDRTRQYYELEDSFDKYGSKR